MKKQNGNRPSLPKKEPKPISPKAKKLAVSLVINSLILLFVYYGAMGLEIQILSSIVMIGYMLVFGGFLIAYIAYNRAFSRKGITPDMLPSSWTEEQKQSYIEDGKIREEKSRWMLSVIIPFLVTFIAEALYLFVWTGLLENIFR